MTPKTWAFRAPTDPTTVECMYLVAGSDLAHYDTPAGNFIGVVMMESTLTLTAAGLAPALLDGARYYRPDAAWLKWASRAVKVGGALLIVRAAN